VRATRHGSGGAAGQWFNVGGGGGAPTIELGLGVGGLASPIVEEARGGVVGRRGGGGVALGAGGRRVGLVGRRGDGALGSAAEDEAEEDGTAQGLSRRQSEGRRHAKREKGSRDPLMHDEPCIKGPHFFSPFPHKDHNINMLQKPVDSGFYKNHENHKYWLKFSSKFDFQI
jgi:hypothetical protein